MVRAAHAAFVASSNYEWDDLLVRTTIYCSCIIEIARLNTLLDALIDNLLYHCTCRTQSLHRKLIISLTRIMIEQAICSVIGGRTGRSFRQVVPGLASGRHKVHDLCFLVAGSPH